MSKWTIFIFFDLPELKNSFGRWDFLGDFQSTGRYNWHILTPYNTDKTIMVINETGDKFIVLQMIAVYDVLFPEFFILCMMMLIMMIQVILDPNLGKWNIPSFPPHWQHRSAAPLSALSSYLLSASLSFLLLRCGCHIFPQKSCCRHQNQWKAYFPPFVPYKSTLCTIPQPPP